MVPILEMKNITKSFPGVIANDDVSIDLRKGEVLALLGENGAGKSTLMSILFGIYQPDSGETYLNGQRIKINNPHEAYAHEIGMVHQHFKLVNNFTVLENIILGNEDIKRGVVQKNEARSKIIELSTKYKLDVDPDALISDITVGMQQRVEILKVLYRNAQILIFDEPTAVLTPQQIDELMDIFRKLQSEGKSIIFISHKLDEILAISNRCAVLKRGKLVGVVDIEETDKQKLSKMMVGREVDFSVELEENNFSNVVLEVNNLTYKQKTSEKNLLNDITFNIKQGEIVSLAGIDGNGQKELVYALTGLIPKVSGNISINGKEIQNLSIRQRTLNGIAHIPEDRHKHGLILDFNLEHNIVLQEYFTENYQKHSFLKFDEITDLATRKIDEFDIRAGRGPKTIVRSMSGGNQQKAIVARELNRNSNLLIAVQPTRGLDVGSIEFIHRQIINERNNGKAVLLVSLELDEVMNISDRILVIHEGKIMGEFDPKKTTYEEIGLYMSGSRGAEQ